jgi:hypothetical protein
MMNRYRQSTRNILLGVVFLLFGYAIAIYVIDPLQHYRKASWYTPLFSNQRFINPGLAKHCAYNTVIIGTSMTENFLPSTVDSTLGVSTLKLSLEGASAYEQRVMVDTAIRTGKVKQVIWGLDVLTFQGAKQRLRNGEGSLPFYLYDDSPWNDYRYLFNIDIAKKYLSKIMLGNLFGVKAYLQPLERFQYWGDNFTSAEQRLYARAGQLAARLQPLQAAPVNQRYLEGLKRSLDYNMVEIIRHNPQIKFTIFFPPYSALFWAKSVEDRKWNELLLFKHYIVDRLLQYDNVVLYDFQDIEAITFDLNSYRDITHYAPSVNTFMLRAFREGTHRLNNGNADQKIDALKEQIANFPEMIDKYHKASHSPTNPGEIPSQDEQ